MEDHVCHICDKSFARAWNLNQHLAAESCIQKKWCCSDCKHQYTNRKAYSRHVCRAKIEKCLIIVRREGIQKGKPDAKGKVPTKQEITGVMDLLDNKPWYTSKAILTIAKGSLWFEKAGDYSDSENDEDSNSDATEEGGDTDFDDDEERSALESTYKSFNSEAFEDDDSTDQQSKTDKGVEEHGRFDNSDDSGGSAAESDESNESDESLDEDERKEKIAYYKNQLAILEAERKAEQQAKQSVRKPKPVEIGFPNIIPEAPKNKVSHSSNSQKDDKPPTQIQIPSPTPSPTPTPSSTQIQKQDSKGLTLKNAGKHEYRNLIIPSKKEKHYYESDHSEDEREYAFENLKSTDESTDEVGLSADDLKRQKEGWVPSFEDKGKSLDEIIAIINKNAEEEIRNGKYLMHPICFKKSSNYSDRAQSLEIPFIAVGHYVNTINAMLEHPDMYQTLLYIKNIATASDYLEADFRLLKKIYLEGRKKSQMPIKVTDIRRYKLEYLDAKNKTWVTDVKGFKLAKILSDNLIDTYSLTNSKLSKAIYSLNNQDVKDQLLDLYQLNKGQSHIQKLTDSKTQARLAKRLCDFIYYLSEEEIA